MKFTIFWFGLSADPPTLAHQKIIKALSIKQGRNRVIVFPAGPLDYKRFTASKRHRRAMMRTWLQAGKFSKNVGLSWFDFNRKKAWSWYKLWKKLKNVFSRVNGDKLAQPPYGGLRSASPKNSRKDIFQLFPQHCFVVGADQYQEIPKTWDQGKKLLEEAQFMVVPRKGYHLPELPSHHQVLNIRPIGYSSTNVRKGALRGLDPMTKAYILDKKLYV